MGSLRENVLVWATPVWQNQPMICSSFASFIEEMQTVFDQPVWGKNTTKHLLILHQGSCNVTEYPWEFSTLAADSDGIMSHSREYLLIIFFYQVKDELAEKHDSDNLDSLMSLTTRVDNCL